MQKYSYQRKSETAVCLFSKTSNIKIHISYPKRKCHKYLIIAIPPCLMHTLPLIRVICVMRSQNNKMVSEMRVYPFMLGFVFGCLLCIPTAMEKIRDRLPRFEGSSQEGPLHKA